MSTAVFPTLFGLGWSMKRTPTWKTRVQEAVSGKKTRIADWSFPIWQWELTFDFLRQAGTGQQVTNFQGQTYAEFAQLAGFFNQRQGMFDSFLYADPDDNTSPTDQGIGVGDGVTTAFQLVRTFGNFAEPIFAPNVVTNVKDNGGVVSGGSYTVSSWGAVTPGVITFNAPPLLGHTIAANFTFYFPCSFTEDNMTFEKFMAALYKGSVKFESRKN